MVEGDVDKRAERGQESKGGKERDVAKIEGEEKRKEREDRKGR